MFFFRFYKKGLRTRVRLIHCVQTGQAEFGNAPSEGLNDFTRLYQAILFD
jgi:hypothetical protein